MAKKKGKVVKAENIVTAITPQIVKERLMGFKVFPGNFLALEWDLDKDGRKDLMIVYKFRSNMQGGDTLKPFMYYQDLNGNEMYEDEERFEINNKKWTN